MRSSEKIYVSEPSDLDFLVGRTVQEVRFGPTVRLVFDEGELVEPAKYLDVGRYTIIDSDGTGHEQHERRPESLGRSLALVGLRVKAASIESSVLRMTFSDGSRLECEPSEDHEAWQVVSDDPKRVVWSTTDGEVLRSS
jgi:hypothetical protein